MDIVNNKQLFELRPPRLVYPNSWLDNIPFVYLLISKLQPKTIVELGTFSGNSFVAFNHACKLLDVNCELFAIDTWEGDEHTGPYTKEVFEELRAYLTRNYPDAHMLRMRFEDALNSFADGSINLLHIDGLHTYEAVKKDFESWKPKLSSNSVVLFHDTLVKEGDFGVWKLWDEIKEQYPSYNLPFANGLGIIIFENSRSPTLDLIRELNKCSDVSTILRLAGQTIQKDYHIQELNEKLIIQKSITDELNSLITSIKSTKGHRIVQWLRKIIYA